MNFVRGTSARHLGFLRARVFQQDYKSDLATEVEAGFAIRIQIIPFRHLIQSYVHFQVWINFICEAVIARMKNNCFE